MIRSKSEDNIVLHQDVHEELLDEHATMRAMLDIIDDSEDPTIFEKLHDNHQSNQERREKGHEWICTSSVTTKARPVQRNLPRLGKKPPADVQLSKTFFSNVNVDTKREKEYIKRSFLPSHVRGAFNTNIMQTFYKAPKTQPVLRPFSREGSMHYQLIKSMNPKLPSFIKIHKHRSLCTPTPCLDHDGFGQHYCDILGPGACGRCIESTNRHIARVIQSKFFPSIEVTRSCLVAPKLSRAMKEGHIKQVRKKRLQELNLPETLSGPQRQPQHITWETLHPKPSSSKISVCGSLPSVSQTSSGSLTINLSFM